MKVAVCTGISGSERIDCLKEAQEYARGEGKELEIINMWKVLNEICRGPLDEATILNIPSTRRMQLFEQAYKKTAQKLEVLRQQQETQKCVVVATHACFHWKTTYLQAFPSQLVPILNPDIFVTIIHNMKDIKRNLDINASHRFTDINYTDVLYWRDHESTETRNWADNLSKDHFVVARSEPPQTLYKILFGVGIKKIYFSYPMSHVSRQQIEAAMKLIAKLRELGYIVFDPGSIDDAKYVDKLLATEPNNASYRDLGRDADDQTVRLDYLLIEQSDILIVRYPAVKLSRSQNHADRMYIPLSAGVICEMVHGHTEGKRVYAVWLPKPEPSPFFAYHCKECFFSEKELLDYLHKNEPSSS